MWVLWVSSMSILSGLFLRQITAHFMTRFFEHIGEFLLPTSCILCKTRQAKSICTQCLYELSILQNRRCIICANPLHGWVCKSCQKKQPSFNSTTCIAGDESRLKLPLDSFRQHGDFNRVAGIIYAWQTLAYKKCMPVDLIIPAPWISSQISSLGFHPSWELAKRMGKIFNTPCIANLIVRYPSESVGEIPHTKILRTQYLSQTCFLNPKIKPSLRASLKDARIAVVSDFMNTGATMEVVSRILKENGAQWVSNWVILKIRQVEKI